MIKSRTVPPAANALLSSMENIEASYILNCQILFIKRRVAIRKSLEIVYKGIIAVVQKLDGLVLVPRCSVRFLDLELRPAILVGDVHPEGQVIFAVLQIFIGNVLFVDPVLVSVDPVVPDDIVLQLLLQRPAELILMKIFLVDFLNP